jgi:hypothetical protein
MLVGGNYRGAFFTRNFDGDDFFGKKSCGLGFRGALLAAQGEGILIFAANAEFLGDVFARSRAWNLRRIAFSLAG